MIQPPIPSRVRGSRRPPRETRSGDRLSVLLVNMYYPPDSAASALRLDQLAQDLARHYQVTVLAAAPSYYPGAAGPPATPAGPRVVRTPSTSFPRAHPVLRLLNYGTYLVAASIRGLFLAPVDIVLVASDPPLVALVGWWLSRLHGARLVTIVLDVHPQALVSLGLLRPGWLADVLRRSTAWVFRRCDGIIAVSESMKRRLIDGGAPPGRINVLSHWEDPDQVRPEPKDNPFSRCHQLTDRYVVMYAGNLGLAQNLPIVIELAGRIRDLEDAVVVLIGEGVLRSRLQAMAEGLRLTNVRFFPYEPPERMPYSLATADLFLIPLKPGLDGLIVPSKVFTVMASGRPFVASADASSQLAALAGRFRCGIRVDPDDLDALECSVRWIYHHQAEGRAMGARGRRALVACYSRSAVISRYVQLLEMIRPSRT